MCSSVAPSMPTRLHCQCSLSIWTTSSPFKLCMNKASQSWRGYRAESIPSNKFSPRMTNLDQSFCHFASAHLAASSVCKVALDFTFQISMPRELSTQPRWRSMCWWEDSNCRSFLLLAPERKAKFWKDCVHRLLKNGHMWKRAKP